MYLFWVLRTQWQWNCYFHGACIVKITKTKRFPKLRPILLGEIGVNLFSVFQWAYFQPPVHFQEVFGRYLWNGPSTLKIAIIKTIILSNFPVELRLKFLLRDPPGLLGGGFEGWASSHYTRCCKSPTRQEGTPFKRASEILFNPITVKSHIQGGNIFCLFA